jgi:hypothetical protein
MSTKIIEDQKGRKRWEGGFCDLRCWARGSQLEVGKRRQVW